MASSSNAAPAKSNISKRRKAALSDGGAEYKAKRSELIRVAAVLFKEKGYKATTLNDIAQLAGLDRATVYYYVGSKEEFLREAIKGVVTRNLAEVDLILGMEDLDPRAKIQRLIERLMISYDESYPYAHVYLQEEMHQVADKRTAWAQDMVRSTRRFEKAVIDLIKKGIDDGIFREDVSVVLAANAIFGMVNWTHRWYKPGGKQSAKEVADTFIKIFFDGMEKR